MKPILANQNLPAIFKKLEPEYKRAIFSFIARLQSKHSQKHYAKDLFQFFQTTGIHDFKRCTREDIFAYRHQLESKQYSNASIRRKISVIRAFFQWLQECELIDKDPSKLCKPPKPDSLYGKTPSINGEQLQKLIDATNSYTISGLQQRLIIELLFYCGIRCSELLGIRVKDIMQVDSYTVLEVHGKGNMKRLIPLQSFLVANIEDYKKRAGHDFSNPSSHLLRGHYGTKDNSKSLSGRGQDPRYKYLRF